MNFARRDPVGARTGGCEQGLLPVMCTRDVINAPADARRTFHSVKGILVTSVSNEDIINSPRALAKRLLLRFNLTTKYPQCGGELHESLQN